MWLRNIVEVETRTLGCSKRARHLIFAAQEIQAFERQGSDDNFVKRKDRKQVFV